MEAQRNPSSGWYQWGALFLAIVDVYLSFTSGRILGFRDAELIGYSTGPLLSVVIILAVSQLSKRARSIVAASKIAFFTLLIFLFGIFSSVVQSRAKLSRLQTQIDAESLNIDEAQALSLASWIQDSVSNGEPVSMQVLGDSDRFVKEVLRDQGWLPPDLRDLAESSGKSFRKVAILDQISGLVKQGGDFDFVKLYKREREPILQFRLTEPSGSLHYLDLYIFKSGDGQLRVDDLRYYNSGERLSKQVLTNASTFKTADSTSSSSEPDAMDDAIRLAQEGKYEEAHTALESLPETVKQQRIVLRCRVQLANNVGAPDAQALFDDFRERFPDDPSIAFSALTAAVARDDLDGIASQIDEIYKAVDGDDYLLWYRVSLYITRKQYRRAIASLSEMESKYNVDIAAGADRELPADFLSSKAFLSWASHSKTAQRFSQSGFARRR